MNIDWTWTYDSGDHGETVTAALLNASVLRSLEVLIQVGQPWDTNKVTFQLTITNLVSGLISTTHHPLRIKSKDIPSVAIQGPSELITRALDGLTIMASASLPACSTAGMLIFSWSIIAGSAVLDGAATSRDLILPPHTLAPGTVTMFQVNVWVASNPEINSYDTVAVRCLAEPLLVSIAGGSRVVGFEQTFLLDASGTYDPDDPDLSQGPLSFQWSCEQEDGEDCGIALERAAIASCDATILGRGNTHVFTVTATKGGKQGTAQVTIRVSQDAASPPSVAILHQTQRAYNPSNKLTLESTIHNLDTSLKTVLEWQIETEGDCTDLAKSSLLTSTSGPSLVVAKNTMHYGAKYCFRLVASTPYAQGYAELQIVMNEAPAGGRLKIEPEEGYALTTVFKMDARGYHDEDTPILYRHGYLKGFDSKRYVSDHGFVHSTETTLPPGSSDANYRYRVFIDVVDAYGCGATTMSEPLAIRPYVLPTNSSLEGVASQMLSESTATGDFQGKARLIQVIADTVNAQFSPAMNGTRRRLQSRASTAARSVLMEEVKDMTMSRLTALNADLVGKFASAIATITAIPAEIDDTIVQSSVIVTEQLSLSKDPIEFEAASNVAATIAQILDCVKYAGCMSPGFSNVVTILGRVANNVGAQLAVGETPYVVHTEQFHLHTQRLPTVVDDQFAIPIRFENVEFDNLRRVHFTCIRWPGNTAVNSDIMAASFEFLHTEVVTLQLHESTLTGAEPLTMPSITVFVNLTLDVARITNGTDVSCATRNSSGWHLQEVHSVLDEVVTCRLHASNADYALVRSLPAGLNMVEEQGLSSRLDPLMIVALATSAALIIGLIIVAILCACSVRRRRTMRVAVKSRYDENNSSPTSALRSPSAPSALRTPSARLKSASVSSHDSKLSGGTSGKQVKFSRAMMSVDEEGRKSIDFDAESKVRNAISSGSSGGRMRSASLRELNSFLSKVRLEHFFNDFRALGARTSKDLLHVDPSDLDELGMSILQKRRFDFALTEIEGYQGPLSSEDSEQELRASSFRSDSSFRSSSFRSSNEYSDDGSMDGSFRDRASQFGGGSIRSRDGSFRTASYRSSATARALQSASFQSATSDTSADSVLSWWNDGSAGSRLDIISGSIKSLSDRPTAGGSETLRSASRKLREALAKQHDREGSYSGKLQRTKLRNNITRTLKMQSALSYDDRRAQSLASAYQHTVKKLQSKSMMTMSDRRMISTDSDGSFKITSKARPRRNSDEGSFRERRGGNVWSDSATSKPRHRRQSDVGSESSFRQRTEDFHSSDDENRHANQTSLRSESGSFKVRAEDRGSLRAARSRRRSDEGSFRESGKATNAMSYGRAKQANTANFHSSDDDAGTSEPATVMGGLLAEMGVQQTRRWSVTGSFRERSSDEVDDGRRTDVDDASSSISVLQISKHGKRTAIDDGSSEHDIFRQRRASHDGSFRERSNTEGHVGTGAPAQTLLASAAELETDVVTDGRPIVQSKSSKKKRKKRKDKSRTQTASSRQSHPADIGGGGSFVSFKEPQNSEPTSNPSNQRDGRTSLGSGHEPTGKLKPLNNTATFGRLRAMSGTFGQHK
eukprot:SAG31_NODE_37_length_31616_cov_38.688359_8_plen_1584_part_00